jgi:sulfoxide reductase heme-binding subunit YedZ
VIHTTGLHRLVFAAGAAAVVHYVWLVTADRRVPLAYAAAFALLVALRLRLPPRAGALARDATTARP